MNPMIVLCGEPNIQTRKLLQVGLEGFGYKVIATESSQDTLKLVAQKSPDVLILNTDFETLPDGIEVCQNVREWSMIPIIFLSERHDKIIKLAALNQGADDYLTMPFDMEELEARIRALVRRSAVSHIGTADPEIRAGQLVVNLVKRQVKLKGKNIHLTPTEYNVLRLFVLNPGKVITYDSLLNQVWHNDPSTPIHSVRVYINMLRKKLQDSGHEPHYIFTEPGIGYRFVDVSK